MKHLVLATCLVIGYTYALAADQTASKVDSCVPALPEAAMQVVGLRYAGWKILALSDLSNDDRELWNQSHRGQCPGVTSGRFTSPNKTDFAVLLINKGASQRQTRLAIVTSNTAASRYEATTVYSNDKVTNYPVIHTSKPGKYHDFYNPQKLIQIDSDVLVYEHLESRTLAFYYKGGKFVRLGISD